jgi:hypothetical protein
VRVLGQAQPAVLQERLRQRRLAAHPRLGDPPALEIGADGLAVMAQMPGDRRDRPALLAQRVRFHISLPGQHPGLPLPRR